MRKNDTTTTKPDAWLSLVLRTMSAAELEAESANPENTPAERAIMRRELARRSGRQS